MDACHPSELNGDLPLSPEQTRAYLAYHAARNAANRSASRRAGMRTRGSPVWGVGRGAGCSPARALLDAFFEWFARRVSPRMSGRRVTIVDLGCGGGARLRTFGEAGIRGELIGIDIERSTKWPSAPVGGLRPTFVRADLHGFDERTLPPIDILISTTALEHLRDDAGIVGRFSARLAPGGVQAHFVPGEESLRLYGKHGWRCYSPLCLSRLFPGATIYRFGGVFSNALHVRAIYEPTSRGAAAMGARHPRMYRALRDTALVMDRITGCRRPSMYAAVSIPASEVQGQRGCRSPGAAESRAA